MLFVLYFEIALGVVIFIEKIKIIVFDKGLSMSANSAIVCGVTIGKEQTKHMKVTVVGIGYVGLSLAVLLAQENEVTALDIVQNKVDALNARSGSTRVIF